MIYFGNICSELSSLPSVSMLCSYEEDKAATHRVLSRGILAGEFGLIEVSGVNVLFLFFN